MIGVAMIVGFSFQGTELMVLLQASPKIRRKTFHARYVSVLANPVVLCVRDPDYQPDYPYTDPSLLRNDVKDISVSPLLWCSSTRVCSLRRR